MTRRTFRALYPGRCPSCEEHIEVGDWIAFSADDVILCEACTRDSRVPRARRETACRRCLLSGLLVDGLCPDCREATR